MNFNLEFKKLRESWMDFEEFKERYQKVEVVEYPNSVLRTVPNPEISVHIITYQHAPYIRQAIESVLMQELDVPWEIIIGDDESTDGTREICIEYAKKYPDLIRLFLHWRGNNIQINERPTHLFQYCYNSYHLRGKYVAVCSGDDEWTDEYKLQKQYDLLVKNQKLSWCSTIAKIVQIDISGKIVEEKITNANLASSRMHINFFDKIPPKFCNTINEDTFVRAILDTQGEHRQLTNIKPIIYRKHSDNMWSKAFLGGEQRKLQLKQKAATRKEIYLTFNKTRFSFYFKHQYYIQLSQNCKYNGDKVKTRYFYFLSIYYLIVDKLYIFIRFKS